MTIKEQLEQEIPQIPEGYKSIKYNVTFVDGTKKVRTFFRDVGGEVVYARGGVKVGGWPIDYSEIKSVKKVKKRTPKPNC